MVAVLHNIRSLHNVGSIFRTADAIGIRKIYLCGFTPTPFDRTGNLRPQFSKVAIGAEKNIEWEKHRHTWRVLDGLKEEGYKIFSVEQDTRSVAYNSSRAGIRKHDKVAIVMGNEIKGLPESVLSRSDRILEIPMAGAVVRQAGHPRKTRVGKESLNVSVAFGIVAFALRYNKKRD